MALDAQHPQYTSRVDDWVITNDVYQGERHVKAKRTVYLPPTAGMVLDGMNSGQPGFVAYDAYLTRAMFPSYFRDAIETAVGLMHRKPADIELPKELEPMRNNATVDGESLQLLLRKINEAQLKDGRCGLLLDAPSGEGPTAMPFFAFYTAARIKNWDDGQRKVSGRKVLEMVVLDESEFVRSADLQWKEVNKYRPLILSSALVTVSAEDQAPVAEGTYITGISADNDANLSSVDFVAPSIAGKTLDEIPFVFINASDTAPDVGIPPLLGLANLCLAIYRAEGDYRQALHAQAQETLVIIGAVDEAPVPGTEGSTPQKAVRVGAGGKIEVPIGGDAKYIGISSKGLSEMRSSLENDRDFAQQQGSRMLSTKGGDQQSGDALKTRVAAQTASLPNIAKTGAEALERILKIAAKLKGADPNLVKVTPNLDFTADIMTGQNLLQYMQARAMGAPFSLQSLHALMKEQGLTDLEFDDEMELVDDEAPMKPPVDNPRGVPGTPPKKQ